ncbi:MAG: efflux transporter periplasmic adaptor subunit [Rickettsiales bacterium]|nr:efflux transporter periplasmic adaptor subunit [Rickettsiales bacterium]
MKILKNKYIQLGLVLVVGITIGILVSNSGSSNNLTTEHQHEEQSQTWTCSMHPQIRQLEPGSCPICGMDLIPLAEEQNEGIDPDAIKMSETAMKLANIQTIKVGSATSEGELRLTGKVTADEQRIHSQTSHIPGRIEKLTVDFTGQYVQKGQTIAQVYSPELVTAQEELFEAFDMKDSNPELYEAARRKLANWKLSNSQIDAIIEAGKPQINFPIKANYSGYVTEKKVNDGDHVMLGQTLYELADLSTIWVMFDVFEKQLPFVQKGNLIEFSTKAGQTYEGNIDYIDPVINPKTRAAKARVTVSNTDQKLKPEMFVTGTLQSNSATKEQLTIPKSAVLWTGKRSVVYIKMNNDQGTYFMLREVELSNALGDSYQIVSGLESGEEIAVQGAFSIDAAAQLAGKNSMMNQPEESASHSMKINESETAYEAPVAFQDQIKAVFLSYLKVKDALVESKTSVAQKAGVELQKELDKVQMELLKGEAHMEWMKDLKVLNHSIDMITESNDLETKREALSPLSDQLYQTIKKFQVSTKGFRQYCPMAFDNQGAFWLSDSEEILNPYFGDAMLTCGNVEEEL